MQLPFISPPREDLGTEDERKKQKEEQLRVYEELDREHEEWQAKYNLQLEALFKHTR